MGTRRGFSGEFMAKVELEAIEDQQTKPGLSKTAQTLAAAPKEDGGVDAAAKKFAVSGNTNSAAIHVRIGNKK